MSIDDEERVRSAVGSFLERWDPTKVGGRAFQRRRFDAGLAWVSYPPGLGGLGVAPSLQAFVDAELALAGAPAPEIDRNILGHGMAAPTILAHGTEAQRFRFLRPIFTNDEIWCQLFSEPNAGSDLAAIATRARRDGESWVVSGQKVWTTLAHTAKWGLLLARSETNEDPHRGLTYFAVDMQERGVEVRPLRQMTGDAEFNEVFLSDVRVPDSNRLGAVGDGWHVAMTTLMNERVAIGSAGRGTSGPLEALLSTWRSHPGDRAARDRVVQCYVEAEVNRLTSLRARDMQIHGTPGPEGSVAKLAFAELNQRTYTECVSLMGAGGMLHDNGYEMSRPDTAALTTGSVRYLFLRSRANSIEGGTSEVLRNVLAERVLGLPREPSGATR